MSSIRKLAGQTVIYGGSSMVGRLLNYLLVPLHTAVFVPAQYGIVTEMYAYVAFLIILLTYGMETAYFRASTAEDEKAPKAYGAALMSLLFTSTLFIALASLFSQPIADLLRYPNNQEYVIWFAMIVGLDAISSIPLARLRSEQKPWHFVIVNLGNVGINILLNLFFLAYCLPKFNAGETNWLIDTFYNPEIGVGYVFIANLFASGFKFLLLTPLFKGISINIDRELLKRMLLYGSPLLIAGLAGIVNETLDRILLKWILIPIHGEEYAMSQVGIYGACYKLSIIITLFLQAFRYAAEPFFFAQEKEKGSRETYARIMNYFVVVCMGIFLLVTLYIDLFKYFIDEPYWVGLHVVPILLMANVFLGIYYNQSVWYKLSGKTRYGAYIALVGAAITLGLNIYLIPIIGYEGSAWATIACYFTMMMLSFVWGRLHYPIPYNIGRVLTYILLGLALYFASIYLPDLGAVVNFLMKAALLLVFLLIFVRLERPMRAFGGNSLE